MNHKGWLAIDFTSHKSYNWKLFCCIRPRAQDSFLVAIVGAEAMFADLGHFTVKSIQVKTLTSQLRYTFSWSYCVIDLKFVNHFLSELNWHFLFFSFLRIYISFCLFQLAFTAVVFPCLLIAYMGQAAYLMKHPLDVERIFYDSVPGKLLGFGWHRYIRLSRTLGYYHCKQLSIWCSLI